MVKRYRCQNPDAEFYEQPLGEWVDFDDYDALAARLAEAERLLAVFVDGSLSEGFQAIDDAIEFLGGPRAANSAGEKP